jgi:hypothetical protein
MASTKRTQNKCKKCGYTWYPRGKHLSQKCPSCGSADVGFAGGGVGIVALLIVGVVLFGGKKESNETSSVTVPTVLHNEVPTISPTTKSILVQTPVPIETQPPPQDEQPETSQLTEKPQTKNLQSQQCSGQGASEQCSEGLTCSPI